MLSIPAVARVLNVSQNAVRRLVKAGRLGAVVVGPRSIRVPAEELARFVAPFAVPTPDQQVRAVSGRPE